LVSLPWLKEKLATAVAFKPLSKTVAPLKFNKLSLWIAKSSFSDTLLSTLLDEIALWINPDTPISTHNSLD